MNIELKLSEIQEQALNERAAALGIDPDTLVTQAVENLLVTSKEESVELLSGEAWIRGFRQWAQSRDGILNPDVDVSRDSIYGRRE